MFFSALSRQNNATSTPTALSTSSSNNYEKLAMNLTLCLLSHIILQFRWRTPAKQDHALCRQDCKVKVFSEGHWDRVHKEEDGGDVQHSSSPYCGSARMPRHAGHQHSTSSYWQNMVQSALIQWIFLLFSFFSCWKIYLLPLKIFFVCPLQVDYGI